MNKFFDNYKPGFDPYKLDVNAAYEFKTLSVVVRNGKIIEENSNGIVNLASTSKPFTMALLSKVLKEDKFLVTKELVKELIFRKQYQHLLENPDYKEVVTWLNKVKISNPKSKLRAIFVGNEAGLYLWKSDGFPIAYINFEELCFNALTLSSNTAIEIARNRLEEILGDKVQKKFDELKIAPTLQLHEGGFKLLNQSRANSGDLKEIVLTFNKLTQFWDSRILKAMHNNPVFFDVGISTHVANAETWEKTGLAWPINYGEDLQKLGYPPHMVMGTLFSIKDSENFTSFGIFKVIAIAVPKGNDDNGFPDIYEKNYTSYVNLVKYRFLSSYRKELFSMVTRNSKVQLNGLSLPQKFRELLKQLVLKLKMLM